MTDILSAEQLPYLQRRAQAKARTHSKLVQTGANQARIVRGDGSGFTTMTMDGRTMQYATSEWISYEWLDRLKAERDLERRAPLGDSHGAWQKCAEIPLNIIYDNLPKEEWADGHAFEKAIVRVCNNSDYKMFRTDGNNRKF